MKLEKNKEVVLVLHVGDKYICDVDIENDEDVKFISLMEDILGEGLREYLFTRDKQEQVSLQCFDRVVYVENKEKFAEHVRSVCDEFRNYCKYYEECKYMTFQYLEKLIHKNNIPQNVRLMSDSGWECSATDMSGVYYHAEESTIVFTQDSYGADKKYCMENGWKMISKDWGPGQWVYQSVIRKQEAK